MHGVEEELVRAGGEGLERVPRVDVGPGRATFLDRRIRAMSNDVPLFALTEEHRAIREAVRELCAAKVAPYAAEVDEESRYWRSGGTFEV